MTRRDARTVQEIEYRDLRPTEDIYGVMQRLEDPTDRVLQDECNHFFRGEFDRLLIDHARGGLVKDDLTYVMELLKIATAKKFDPSGLPVSYRVLASKYGWSF